jgi:hypothetical protein
VINKNNINTDYYWKWVKNILLLIWILRKYKNLLKRRSINLKIDSNFVNIVKIFYRESKASQSIEWMFLFSIDFIVLLIY